MYDLETVNYKQKQSFIDRVFFARRKNCTGFIGLMTMLCASLIISTGFLMTAKHQSSSDFNMENVKQLYSQYSPSKYFSMSKDQKMPTLQNTNENYRRENATIMSLVRNEELWKMVDSIRDVEDRFNNKFHYDWVFLNEEEFTEEFKFVVSNLVSGTAKFGKIPREHWSFPDNLDVEKYSQNKKAMMKQNIIYSELDSYRHMCRFNSGFFYKHELLKEYKWYWRVEPNIKIYCDVNYDPFKYMIDNNKTYGFTMALQELRSTIPTLWSATQEFVIQNPQVLAQNNLAGFITDENMSEYNLCHFWSNFEIADMDFFRSEAYEKYFQYLDSKKGFFYERWGDAPVHSIAVSLLLDKTQVHMFRDFGYYHNPFSSCPLDKSVWETNKCSCNFNEDFTFSLFSCAPLYYDLQGLVKPPDWHERVKHAATPRTH